MNRKRSGAWRRPFLIGVAALTCGYVVCAAWNCVPPASHSETSEVKLSRGQQSPRGIQTAVERAQSTFDELTRAAVGASIESPTETIESNDGTNDKEWLSLPRSRDALGSTFARMRSQKAVFFRSPLLNPMDIMIRKDNRDAFDHAYKEAVENLRLIRRMKYKAAMDQVVSMVGEGRFVRVPEVEGRLWQLAGSDESVSPSDWFVYGTASGDQYRVRWSDLTWVTQSEDLADFMETQVDAMVVEFFGRLGALRPDQMHLLMTYCTGNGRQRLRDLAKSDPAQYARVRAAIFGR